VVADHALHERGVTGGMRQRGGSSAGFRAHHFALFAGPPRLHELRLAAG
jgi:hypothetical protein